MAKYVLKRLVIGVVTLFALATITFFLMHIIPGSPFAGETSKLPAAVKEKLIEKYGLDTCVVTLGSRGCAGANKKGETFVLPPFSGYDVIDTTGAGDVYHGGFVFAHSQGWDLEYCARYASAVSYIKCTTLGGRVGIPSRKVVEQFLKDGTIDHTEAEERRDHYAGVMRFR